MGLETGELAATAIRAVLAGANALRPFLGEERRLAVHEKGTNDFVTAADLAAERAVREAIRSAHPGHGILGEEEAGARLDAPGPTWIVDPLDGTTNFIHGFPPFAVAAGCAVRGTVVAAAIVAPVLGELFWGARGTGAFAAPLEPARNADPGRLARGSGGRHLRVSSRAGLPGALVATGFPFRRLEHLEDYLVQFRAVLRVAAGIRRCGSACLDLAWVAAGRLDGFWEEGLGPWDLAAGSLLVEEAGGKVTDLDGGSGFLARGGVVAAAPGVHGGLLEAVRTGSPR